MDKNNNNNMSVEATMETLTAMCKQEAAYQTCDYLHQSHPCTGTTTAPLNDATMPDIDEDSRAKMVAWCYRVIEFCQFDRETVAIAMNILDRYMVTPQGEAAKNPCVYQLAAMTCLYTAVKIHEPEAMDPTLVSKISHDTYTEQEIEAMEIQILNAVGWRVNPPTALAFVRECLNLISNAQLDKMTRETVYTLAKVQTELAVAEYDFLVVSPSIVAYCSLMNALSSVGIDQIALLNIISKLSQTAILANLNAMQLSFLAEVQACMHSSFLQQPSAKIMIQTSGPTAFNNKLASSDNMDIETSPSCSPRCISANSL